MNVIKEREAILKNGLHVIITYKNPKTGEYWASFGNGIDMWISPDKIEKWI